MIAYGAFRSDQYQIGGRLLNDNYLPFTLGGHHSVSTGQLAAVNASHALLTGVNSFQCKMIILCRLNIPVDV